MPLGFKVRANVADFQLRVQGKVNARLFSLLLEKCWLERLALICFQTQGSIYTSSWKITWILSLFIFLHFFLSFYKIVPVARSWWSVAQGCFSMLAMSMCTVPGITVHSRQQVSQFLRHIGQSSGTLIHHYLPEGEQTRLWMISFTRPLYCQCCVIAVRVQPRCSCAPV